MCVRVPVRVSVHVVDHALTAVLIDFIFGMNIDLIPGSDIGPIKLIFKFIKDHLWTKYGLCDEKKTQFYCAKEALGRPRHVMRVP